MKMIRRLLIIVVALLFAYGGVAKAQTGNPDKIDPELQELMHQSQDASETFRVIIEMTEQYNDPNLERGTAMMTRAQRREYVVNELKRFSEQSQAEVVRYLDQQSTRGQVNVLHRFWIFNGMCCEATAECIGELSMRRDVRYVALDKEVESDEVNGRNNERGTPPYSGVQWHIQKVNANSVWSLGYTGEGVVVAVIDTGVNYNHVDIASKMWDGSPHYQHHGWDFYNNDDNPIDVTTDGGHGTHVAGIVASEGSNYKAGIAPGARIMALKVFGDNHSEQHKEGPTTHMICQAVEFAVDNGADVISVSIGWSGVGGVAIYRNTYVNVLHAGVVATICAGNQGDKKVNNGVDLKYPVPFNIDAAGNCPPPWQNPDQYLQGGASAVICVGATDINDVRAPYSSIGPVTWCEGDYIGDYHDYPCNGSNIGLIRPDVVAPGGVGENQPGSVWSLSHKNNSGYVGYQGTSMATPCVAGIIALMLQANPYLTPAKIDEILETTAVACNGQTEKNNYYGAGRVDALQAVTAAINTNMPSSFHISASKSPNKQCYDVAGSGHYSLGESCTLIASPANHFIGWVKDGIEVSRDPSFTFVVGADEHYVAIFDDVTVPCHQIRTDYNPRDVGAVYDISEGGDFFSGIIWTLYTIPNEGWQFYNWTKNGVIVSTNPEFSFTVTEDATYIANFKRECIINVEAMPTIAGTIEGGGTYLEGDQCTIVATPNPGYIFKGWYLHGALFPINPLPTFTFTVTGSMNMIAKFQPATPTTDVYQYYCWFDQDYSTVQTGSFQTTETFFALDASALSEGIHTLHVMLDDNGLTAPKTYLFLKTPEVLPVSSYNYHCWFDQDYSTVQTGTFGGGGYSVALDASELDEGIHTLHVMLEGNELTSAKTYIFLKAPVTSPTSIYTYHCWFDQDYETVQTGTFGGDGYCFALDATELDEGIHTMHVMLEGNDLTAAKTYLFLKAPVVSPTSTYTYHCWFDNDYGTVQTGTFGGEGYSFALDVGELDNGLHFVNVMLEGNELTSAKRYLFCKKPVGGSGIYRWEYCLNGQWFDAVVTNLVPTVRTLDILTMLPVDPLPIRSQDFEFEPNGGQPEIYAKNTITFRFWDDENRFLDRSAIYVDATVHEPVVADWIQRNTTETIATPAANHIHWFKLDAEVGDSLAFKSDVYCTMELFAPSGARQFKVMNAASVAFNGICANESGIYYLAVHDVEGSYENVSVTYLFLREMTAVTALNAGWNWWTPTVWTDISTLQSTLSDYLIQIQVQDEMPTGNINPGKMLKIQTSVACALSLRGMPITAASITVNPGATWFGYIGVEAPITQALNGFPPSMDDKIISQDGGFAVYNGMEWVGTLTTLEPGKGYVYVSTAAWSKTIVFE